MTQLQATDPQYCWKLPKLEEAGATLSLHLSDFGLQNGGRITICCLRRPVCGRLLWQPQDNVSHHDLSPELHTCLLTCLPGSSSLVRSVPTLRPLSWGTAPLVPKSEPSGHPGPSPTPPCHCHPMTQPSLSIPPSHLFLDTEQMQPRAALQT